MIITKSKRMGWAGRVGHMGEKRNPYTIRVGNPEEETIWKTFM
jgi:hypothetical protein